MPDILSTLVGQLLGGQQLVQQNPNYLDAQGNPIAGQTPYVKPNLATRLFFPEAAENTTTLNNLPFQEKVQHANQVGIATGDVNKVRGLYGPGIGTDPNVTDQQIAIMSGQNPSMQGVYNVDDLRARQAAGIPALNARSDASSLLSTARQNEAGLATNLPERLSAERGALADLSVAETPFKLNLMPAQYGALESDALKTVKLNPSIIERTMAENEARLKTLPSETAREIAGNESSLRTIPHTEAATIGTADVTTNQAGRELAAKPILDQTFQTRVGTDSANAKVENALATDKVGRIPTLTALQGNQIANESHSAAFPAPDQSPVYRGGDGRLHLNPYYMNMMDMMNAKLKGGSGGAIPLGNGLHIINTTPAKPVVSPAPITGNPITNMSPVSQTFKTATQQPAPMIDTQAFLNKINTRKSGANQTVALDHLANRLAKAISLPSNLQQKTVGSSTLTAGDLKRVATLGFSPGYEESMIRSALKGQNKQLSQSAVFDALKKLPPEQQHEILSEALLKGGYR